ncbi:hypothetical protein ACFW2D_17520, partial [Streptomyces sp. NPDC058914]
MTAAGDHGIPVMTAAGDHGSLVKNAAGDHGNPVLGSDATATGRPEATPAGFPASPLPALPSRASARLTPPSRAPVPQHPRLRGRRSRNTPAFAGAG